MTRLLKTVGNKSRSHGSIAMLFESGLRVLNLQLIKPCSVDRMAAGLTLLLITEVGFFS